MMDADRFEAEQRAREYFHGLVVLPGAWTVLRVDGRAFSRLTKEHFDKPFDPRFSELMTHTAQALLVELGGRYAYTESDEISVLFDPSHDLFGGGVEKLVSIGAGIASATFTYRFGEAAHFDGRLWMGANDFDVHDYFSWRQSDAARCALNGWAYWALRKDGRTISQATQALKGKSTAYKNELIFQSGTNFNDVPAWQRRGIGLWWEIFERDGFDPVRQVEVTATRRRVHIERELPVKDAYRALLASLIAE